MALILLLVVSYSAAASFDDLRCHICGTPIAAQEKYFQVKDGQEVYCERCFSSAPRCSLCKLPMAPRDIDPDTGACPQCLAKLPRCKACGKPIVGVAYKSSLSNGVFCGECKSNRPACYICGVPVGSSHWKYPDGRIICNECGERAVIDSGEIRKIMQDVQATVEQRLGLKVKKPYFVRAERLHGVPSTSADVRAEALSDQSPLYGKELGMYRRTKDQSEIILLFGLPPEMLYEAGAHEYAHAWQAENSSLDLPAELREGFAQWVAADVLRAKGFKGALENLELRRDFPYGTGYQRLKKLQQKIILELQQK